MGWNKLGQGCPTCSLWGHRSPLNFFMCPTAYLNFLVCYDSNVQGRDGLYVDHDVLAC